MQHTRETTRGIKEGVFKIKMYLRWPINPKVTGRDKAGEERKCPIPQTQFILYFEFLVNTNSGRNLLLLCLF